MTNVLADATHATNQDELYNWRYCGRAYVHTHGGYWLLLYERKYIDFIPEDRCLTSMADEGRQFKIWGDLIRYEVKQVSERTGETEFLHHRSWYLVIPQTKYKGPI